MTYNASGNIVHQTVPEPIHDKGWGISDEELRRRCQTCHITNPILCRETCSLWKIKSAQNTFRKELPDQPDPATILHVTSISHNRRIIQALLQEPSSIDELKQQLRETEENSDKTTMLDSDIKTLIQMGLVRPENEMYRLTSAGQKIVEALSQFSELPEKPEGYEERVLYSLIDGIQTFDALTKTVPSKELTQALQRLQAHNLIAKKHSKGEVLYFTTKRRPTRRLSPMELEIFKGIPRKGITPKELSEKVSMNLQRTYRYLRLLRYKRHVIRQRQELAFELTPAGCQTVEFLQSISKVVQDLSPEDFA